MYKSYFLQKSVNSRQRFPSPQLLPCSPSTTPFLSLPPHSTQTDGLFFISLLHILLHIQLHRNIQTTEAIRVVFSICEPRVHHILLDDKSLKRLIPPRGFSLSQQSLAAISWKWQWSYTHGTSSILLTQQDLNNDNTKIKM